MSVCSRVFAASPSKATTAARVAASTGLRMLERAHQPSVRWAWSLNAAASVMGSVGALVLALYLGLIQTLLIGGALYLLAALVAGTSSVTRAARA